MPSCLTLASSGMTLGRTGMSRAAFPSHSRMTLIRHAFTTTSPYLYRRTFSHSSSSSTSVSDLKPDTLNPVDYAAIEQKWLQRWKSGKGAPAGKATEKRLEESNLSGKQISALSNNNNKNKEKFYILSMFPYPSGILHMGHVRVYTISDALARARRMMGYDVVHPMGWDAFGLPAENAAIERSIHPNEWTVKNIEVMKSQMEKILADFDWERELRTCSPEYYQWTQYLFLKLHEAGLAYQKEAVVNWDPIDQTVLANEQVDAEGKSWRSGAVVEKRKLRQWFFKITEYADDLLQDLDRLSHWPDRVKQMQRNWIGKSKGAEFDFKINRHNVASTTTTSQDNNNNTQKNHEMIQVFTSRPDTVHGVQFLAVSTEHPILESVPESHHKALEDFKESLKTVAAAGSGSEGVVEVKPEGVDTGLFADHPFLPGTKIPVYAVNYVVSDYGTGAVMGVPGHDERDFNFAQSQGIKPKYVIVPGKNESSHPPSHKDDLQQVLTARGVLSGDCGEFSHMTSEDASKAIIDKAQRLGFGREKTSFRIRDWLLSRQRYWGAPIPMIHCLHGCGPVPVPVKDLPVVLPMDVEFTGRGGSPLKQIESWVNCSCPK
ncbi:hypothetical protein BG004_003189 [Podila humilis]|nr:hypothetical protein BG004_003189 [Podila humilis]